ncbi:hypothetical protein ACWEMW_26320 [Streptomyces sp. NPDC004684]
MPPKTTAHRIIKGRILPLTPQQAVAFLEACDVTTPEEFERSLAAAARVASGNIRALDRRTRPHSAKDRRNFVNGAAPDLKAA